MKTCNQPHKLVEMSDAVESVQDNGHVSLTRLKACITDAAQGLLISHDTTCAWHNLLNSHYYRYHDMHPMRVLFKIPKAPSPTLTDTMKWSDDFHAALAKAVEKSPSDRPTARELLSMPFFKDHENKAPLRDL